jgi:hypothetical protein
MSTEPWVPPERPSWSSDIEPSESVATAADNGGPLVIDLAMTCGIYQLPFLVIAELRDACVFFTKNKPVTAATPAAQGAATAFELIGRFNQFEAHPRWACPHCGSRGHPLGFHFWFCCNNMICAGIIDGGGSYCPCGQVCFPQVTSDHHEVRAVRLDAPDPDVGGLLLEHLSDRKLIGRSTTS